MEDGRLVVGRLLLCSRSCRREQSRLRNAFKERSPNDGTETLVNGKLVRQCNYSSTGWSSCIGPRIRSPARCRSGTRRVRRPGGVCAHAGSGSSETAKFAPSCCGRSGPSTGGTVRQPEHQSPNFEHLEQLLQLLHGIAIPELDVHLGLTGLRKRCPPSWSERWSSCSSRACSSRRSRSSSFSSISSRDRFLPLVFFGLRDRYSTKRATASPQIGHAGSFSVLQNCRYAVICGR
ncbi:hypothetical protein DFJ74DRAFT_157447 [Hyaloraphidium curvatum]|nr:hypothetical protein DFJ74DRAFT_157447 [Hyaloraphidium curvatum]